MKIVRFLLACIVTAIVAFPMSSCELNDISGAKEEEEEEKEIGVITINRVDHKIIEAGYMIIDFHTIVQFIIEDPQGPYNTSTIELEFPTSLTGDWYTLAPINNPDPNTPNWRITLQNTYIGNGTDMGRISEGSVLIKQLSPLDKKKNEYECTVAFEVILANGTSASAGVHAKFKNYTLWIGGR